MRTRSGTDFASILRMTCPRWTLTVTRQAQLGCDLRVDPPGDHELHDFALALRERAVAHLQLGQARCVASPCAVAFDGRVDGVEQRLLLERLAEIAADTRVASARLRQLFGVCRDDHGGNAVARRGKLLM